MNKPRNLSIILTVVSGIGMIATCVAVAKQTPKANERLKSAEEKKGEPLTPIEKAVAVAPSYAPAAAIGVSTLTCMIGSTVLDRKEQASLSSAIALGQNYISKYKGKIQEVFGVEEEKKIGEEVKKEIQIEEAKDSYFSYDSWCQICSNGSDNNPGTPMLFYDLASGTFFRKSLEQVLLAEYHLNRNYILEGEQTLNDWFDNLGLMDHMDELYDNLVWAPLDEGEYWIDFNHTKKKTDDGEDYYEIEIITEPHHLDEMAEDIPFK